MFVAVLVTQCILNELSQHEATNIIENKGLFTSANFGIFVKYT